MKVWWWRGRIPSYPLRCRWKLITIVCKLLYNLFHQFRGLTTYLYRGQNLFIKYHESWTSQYSSMGVWYAFPKNQGTWLTKRIAWLREKWWAWLSNGYPFSLRWGLTTNLLDIYSKMAISFWEVAKKTKVSQLKGIPLSKIIPVSKWFISMVIVFIP